MYCMVVICVSSISMSSLYVHVSNGQLRALRSLFWFMAFNLHVSSRSLLFVSARYPRTARTHYRVRIHSGLFASFFFLFSIRNDDFFFGVVLLSMFVLFGSRFFPHF